MNHDPRNHPETPDALLSGKTLVVSHEAVRPNGYNYNAQSPGTFTKLVESMRRFGFVQPIIVRELNAGLYEIINGEHRWRAARELNMPDVTIVNLGHVDDVRAKQLAVVLNELGGQPDQVRLADLLRDINSSVEFDDLLKVMPFSERELSTYIESVDFSFASLSDQDTRPQSSVEEEQAKATTPEEADEDARAGFQPAQSKLVLNMSAVEARALKKRLRVISKDLVEAVAMAVESWEAHAQDVKA